MISKSNSKSHLKIIQLRRIFILFFFFKNWFCLALGKFRWIWYVTMDDGIPMFIFFLYYFSIIVFELLWWSGMPPPPAPLPVRPRQRSVDSHPLDALKGGIVGLQQLIKGWPIAFVRFSIWFLSISFGWDVAIGWNVFTLPKIGKRSDRLEKNSGWNRVVVWHLVNFSKLFVG